MSTAYRRW